MQIHFSACFKECAQESETRERGADKKFFGLFENSVSSGELKTLGGVGGGGGTFVVFFLKYTAALRRTLYSYSQISSLSFLFPFSPFLSPSPLCVGYVDRQGKGGACLSWFMTPGLPEGERVSSEHFPQACYPSPKSSKMSPPGGIPASQWLASL